MADLFLVPDAERKPTTMPEGFQPNAHHRALALQYGLDLEEELAAFADHHLGKGSRFLAWDRAFNTWLRRSVEFRSRKFVQGPSDTQMVGSKANHLPCPVGFCDGSGWYVDRVSRKISDCECRRRLV